MTKEMKNADTCCKYTCCADGCCSNNCKTGDAAKVAAVMDVVVIQ